MGTPSITVQTLKLIYDDEMYDSIKLLWLKVASYVDTSPTQKEGK